MVHFSKFIVSYLIKDKTANTIVNKLQNCFNTYDIPEQIGCDNGSEFINKKVMELFNTNKISLVRGMVYNPHSQGIIKRGHRIIKNVLICHYLEKKDEFDLQESLNVVVNRYNNITHSTTKKKPREVFF